MTAPLMDAPLRHDEIRQVMDRAAELAKEAGHAWVTEVDMLTHLGPEVGGNRPVEGYSLAFKLPSQGVRLDQALELALWFSGKSGRMDSVPAAQACRLEYHELWFGRFTAANLRQL